MTEEILRDQSRSGLEDVASSKDMLKTELSNNYSWPDGLSLQYV